MFIIIDVPTMAATSVAVQTEAIQNRGNANEFGV